MTKKHIKEEKPMLFTAGNDWHLDIFLEANAQIMEINLKTFSKVKPDYIYNIVWNLVLQNGAQTQIPIDVAKINHSTSDEKVHLAYEITYYF
jgi:hypothetical protein